MRRSTLMTVATLVLLAAVPARGQKKPKQGDAALAQYLYTVADDFIVEVYHNGERVPGDWLVFNVVNNRLHLRAQQRKVVVLRQPGSSSSRAE
jgi:hypothetical protein